MSETPPLLTLARPSSVPTEHIPGVADAPLNASETDSFNAITAHYDNPPALLPAPVGDKDRILEGVVVDRSVAESAPQTDTLSKQERSSWPRNMDPTRWLGADTTVDQGPTGIGEQILEKLDEQTIVLNGLAGLLGGNRNRGGRGLGETGFEPGDNGIVSYGTINEFYTGTGAHTHNGILQGRGVSKGIGMLMPIYDIDNPRKRTVHSGGQRRFVAKNPAEMTDPQLTELVESVTNGKGRRRGRPGRFSAVRNRDLYEDATRTRERIDEQAALGLRDSFAYSMEDAGNIAEYMVEVALGDIALMGNGSRLRGTTARGFEWARQRIGVQTVQRTKRHAWKWAANRVHNFAHHRERFTITNPPGIKASKGGLAYPINNFRRNIRSRYELDPRTGKVVHRGNLPALEHLEERMRKNEHRAVAELSLSQAILRQRRRQNFDAGVDLGVRAGAATARGSGNAVRATGRGARRAYDTTRRDARNTWQSVVRPGVGVTWQNTRTRAQRASQAARRSTDPRNWPLF
jgi:hypothetical protein